MAGKDGTREQRVMVGRTARYFLAGDSAGATDVWYVLHGYGQLARTMIDSCRALEQPGTLIVAPEGLSRFYAEAVAGSHAAAAVGASWMTREDRDGEIADYLALLDRVHADVGATVPATAHVHVLGFSQGVATAARWVATGSVRFASVTGWGAALDPAGIGAEPGSGQPVFTCVRGARDQRFSLEDFERSVTALEGAGLDVAAFTFAGGHRLDDATLERVSSRVTGRRSSR